MASHLRVITAAAPDGGVVQIARSLASVDNVLSNLRTVLFLVIDGRDRDLGLARPV